MKEHNMISRVISSHLGLMYIETLCIILKRARIVKTSHQLICHQLTLVQKANNDKDYDDWEWNGEDKKFR